MAATGPSRGAWCRRAPRVVAALVAAALMAVGCAYEDREPGLFGREAPEPSGWQTSLSPPRSPPAAANPELPVAGESVWTSADGLGVQIRFAVHAVRRLDGATVLDWSVTPLRGFNLQPGDPVPASFLLGLSRPGEARPDIVLVDSPSQTVYRPLVAGPDSAACLCSPIWLSPDRLRVGETTLLQVAFPALPAALRSIDVNIASVPQFWRVPVAPAGHIPVVKTPTDLTRPAELDLREAASEMFRYGASEQVFRVRVHRVLASRTFTSMEWAIVSVTGGDGVEEAAAPPFARRDVIALTGANPVAASGPVLRSGGGRLDLITRVMTDDRRISGEAAECLCSDLRAWTAVLRRPDKEATIVTNYPALPESTRRVEVLFDGLDPMTVPVTQADDASTKTAGPIPSAPEYWRFRRGNPPLGWGAGEWPTPVPGRALLDAYTATVDRLVR